MQEAATVEAEGVGQILARVEIIKAQLPQRRSDEHVLSDVSSDPAAYASAWSDFTNANADTGVISIIV